VLIYSKQKLDGKSSPQKSGAGFTLIEMILVIFLGTLLLLGLFSLYDWHSKMYNYQQGLVRVSESARNSSQAILEHTTQAYRVVASQTINGTVYTSSSTALVLQLPAVDGSSNVVPGKWDHVVFFASGTNLYQIISPDPASSRMGGTRLLSDVLGEIEFTYDNGDFTQVRRVAVHIYTEIQVRDQTVTQDLQQNIYLKNY
jgi:hypothetical protein